MTVNDFELDGEIISKINRRVSTCIRVPLNLLPIFKRILSRYRDLERGDFLIGSYSLSLSGNEILEKFCDETNLIKFEICRKK
jgi:hypothetical protein